MENESSVAPQPVPQNLTEPPQNSKKSKYLFLLVTLIVLAVAALVISNFSTHDNPENIEGSVQKNDSQVSQQSSDPIPFEEMTIPYLRKKNYESALGEREFAYNGTGYTAYITNYTSDGLRVNGLLTVPDGDTPNGGWPAIVFVHGYIPPTQYTTNGESYSSYVDYLAQSGFVVFKIDLRGHGESEGEPGGGYYGSDYVVDTLNARAALQTSEFVHPEKIGLWGHSMAGNTLARSMAVRPEIPAAVIWAGAVYSYVDMRTYGIQDSSYRPPENNTQRQNRRRELFEKVGSPSATSSFWQMVAPIYFVKDLKGAVQIHHAVDDDVVNIGYSRDLTEALKNAKVTHELHEYSSGGHNISGSSFNTAMQRTVDFFNTHLNK